MTCEARAACCAETVTALAATDWGDPPVLVVDQSTNPVGEERILDTGRRLLTIAAGESDELFVSFEDDLTFNASIRHNLEHWAPIVERTAGTYLFASLYNPNVVLPATPADPAPAAVGDPNWFYGTQAIVVSVTTARAILDQWDDAVGAYDLRVSRLAARWSPIWFHRPSLVQHRPVASVWGGVPHHAVDFSPDWRA
jgi:hypothetical protein